MEEMYGLLLYSTKFLHVYSLHHLLAVSDAGLLKCLTATKFLYDAGLFEFTLKLL